MASVNQSRSSKKSAERFSYAGSYVPSSLKLSCTRETGRLSVIGKAPMPMTMRRNCARQFIQDEPGDLDALAIAACTATDDGDVIGHIFLRNCGAAAPPYRLSW